MIALLLEIEGNIISSLGWPAWALRTVEALCAVIVLLTAVQYTINSFISTQSKSIADFKKTSSAFRTFQLQYLSVYFTVMLADWLQGTNMYTLYASYGVNIGALFLTGFLSSAVFGTFLGVYVDTWGRRFGCLIFCVLEIIINLVEHIPSMPLLLIGRILGGLSTSLLFSAFESWMVSEHRKRKFPEEWLSGTFAVASWGNGISAIVAGFLAQLAADVGGDIGPFQLAIVLTVLALFLILLWPENYGEGGDNREDAGFSSLESIASSMQSAGKVIYKNPAIFLLGTSQAFFEGAVYTFVFMWVPSMLELTKGESLPTGLVFSTFMLAMTAGGMLFGILLPIFPGGAVTFCATVFAASACSMMIPICCFEFWYVFIAFLVLEAMLGMFNSCGATLRSIYYPEALQSSIMSIFRFPLNLLVVIGTLLTNRADSVESLQMVYYVVVGMHFVAFCLQIAIPFFPIPHTSGNAKKTD